MTAEFKTLDFPFALKDVTEEGTFEGYGSVFGNLDSDREIIVPGAFAKTLAERAGKIRLLWQHRWDMPVGKWIELREDDHGLFSKGQLAIKATQPRDVHELLKMGAVDGESIGFRTLRSEIDENTGIRRLIELELWEVSLVTFPANEAATVAAVKEARAATLAGMAEELETEREFERFLRDVGFSKTKAKAITAVGFKAAGRDGPAYDLTRALLRASHTIRGEQ